MGAGSNYLTSWLGLAGVVLLVGSCLPPPWAVGVPDYEAPTLDSFL